MAYGIRKAYLNDNSIFLIELANINKKFRFFSEYKKYYKWSRTNLHRVTKVQETKNSR